MPTRYCKWVTVSGVSGGLLQWEDHDRPSSEGKQLAKRHVEDLDTRIRECVEIRDALQYLSDQCKDDHRPDRAILANLAGQSHCS